MEEVEHFLILLVVFPREIQHILSTSIGSFVCVYMSKTPDPHARLTQLHSGTINDSRLIHPLPYRQNVRGSTGAQTGRSVG
jgi:hypothetical protein